MSTLTFNNSTIAMDVGSRANRPDLFSRVIKNREAAAKAHVMSFLARLDDAHLISLGFDAADVAAIRRGEHRLPKALRTAA